MMITRVASNPVLSDKDVPYDASCVFNAGVAKFRGEYIMIFRNDYNYDGHGAGFGGTNIGLARSADGIEWKVDPEPIITQEQLRREWASSHPARFDEMEIRRVYDPRITIIEDQIYLCMAMDTEHGILGAMVQTSDLKTFELLSISTPDNRNMVLFPEKIDGNFVRLERPFPIYGRSAKEAFDVWMSSSPDMRFWGETRLLLGAEEVPYANCKIGPAAPPIRTEAGWLTTIHGVHYDADKPLDAWGGQNWRKTYYGGLMLLDLKDPGKVIGLMKEPLLTPETDYELNGFRGSVIFPGGMILEDDGEVKIYYGAADTVVALATAQVDDLIKACEPF